MDGLKKGCPGPSKPTIDEPIARREIRLPDMACGRTKHSRFERPIKRIILMDEQADILKLVEISRLYYERNLTQAKIAKKMNISRPAVSKLLSEARNRGIVKIQIKSPLLSDLPLLQELCEVYRLKGGLVVPSGSADDKMIMRLLVSQASLYFEKLLPQVNRVGLGWGDTMGRLVDELKQKIFLDEKRGCVCPVIGSAPNDIRWFQTNELAPIFAENT